MDVEVRDALADAVVDRYESTFGIEGPFDGGLQLLNGLKQRAYLLGRQVRQSGNVRGGYQQNVAGEERAAVKEGYCIVAAPDDFGREFAGGDVAKYTRH